MDGVALAEVPTKNLQFTYALNEVGSVNWQMPIEDEKADPDLLAEGEREIVIYRDGVRVWGGYLWFVGGSSGEETIRVQGEGYLSRLLRRHIDEKRTYVDEEQLDIAWDLIDWTQGLPGGDLGITRFDPDEDSEVLRTRRYKEWERTNIGQELQDFSELNDGFDFEITADKKWKTYFPERGSNNGLVFDLKKNIGNIAYEKDAKDVVSELTGMGTGTDRDRCIAVVTHMPTLTQFGLLQDTEDFSNIKSYDTLVARTTGALRLRKMPRRQPQLSIQTDDPPFDAYDIGDTVRVKARKGWLNINRDMRIVVQTVQVSDEGREAISLFFDETTSA